MFKVIVAGVILTIIAVFAFTMIDPKVNKNSTDTTTSISGDFNSITVTGEVNKPGTYVLKDGDTIQELLLSAGGVSENADENAYFTSTKLIKGISYYIAPLYDQSDICGTQKIKKVNVNSAKRDELMEVNGVGSSLATLIISYRDKNGTYTYLEELKQVSGIGNAVFEKIKNFICLK